MAKKPFVVVYPKMTEEEQARYQLGCMVLVLKAFAVVMFYVAFFYLWERPQLWIHLFQR